MALRITLAAVDGSLAKAWQEHCGDLDFVTVARCSIVDLQCDAVISPANSFGFMDGGVDAAYSHRFGWSIQDRLQRQIRDRHDGELLVGAAEIVETGDARIPYLISAPTMRVPMILGGETVNPYLAARAALRLISSGTFSDGALQGERISDAIQSIAFPGLGTGIGRVSAAVCARQMRAAIDDVILRPKEFPTSWVDAQVRHQHLFADRLRDLQQE